MKYSAIVILIIFMLVVIPVSAVEINPPVQGTSFWCKNDLTKWLCPKPGAQGPQGIQGIENMTANMTAGPPGPQGPAGEAGAPGGDSGLILYFNNTASDIAGYESIRNVPSSANEVDESAIINASHSPVRVDSYAASLAITNTTRIPAGLWEFHLYSYLSTVTGTSYINVSVFNRTASGTETMLFTTRTQVSATVPTAYIIDYVQENDYTIASTDRLVFKIYGETATVPDRTFHFVYQGSQHTSHIHTPLNFPTSHHTLTDLSAYDDHPQYLNLNGRTPPGQNIIGNISIGAGLPYSPNNRRNFITLGGEESGGLGGIIFNGSPSFPGYWEIMGGASGNPNGIDLSIRNNSQVVMIFKQYTNRIGIGGTTAPTKTVEIKGSLEIMNDSSETFHTGFVFNPYRGSSSNRWLEINQSASNNIFVFQGWDVGDPNGAVDTTISFQPNGGKVGIGTISPGPLFDVNGDARFRNCSGTPYMNATGYMFCISDETKKQNVKSYTTGLDAIHTITPISWTAGYSGGETLTGFSYQDVKKTLPNSVVTHIVTKEVDDMSKTPDENGERPKKEVPTGETYGTVDLSGLVATLWNAMQEEDAKVTAMQATIDAQQKQIDELKARLDKAGIKP